MKMRLLIVVLFCVFFTLNLFGQSKLRNQFKKPHYQEVNFEEMMRRYFGKEIGIFNKVEGIYSVSCVITKTSKRFLSARERTKVIDRKDNYARVAILKDWPGTDRDFIEVSLSYRSANKYPIVGEISTLADGEAYIYKHIEPDGSTLDFSMATQPNDLIEGEHSEMHRRKTIRYKLSFLKIYPKTQTEQIVLQSN